MPIYEKPARPLTWLITGSSSGLGLALTRVVQAQGHTVIATSRDPSKVPELVAEVESHGGEWYPLDVTSASSTASLMETLASKGKQIDVLVNNAGTVAFGVMEQHDDEDLRAQMELLYIGPNRLIRAVLPSMRKQRFGSIINISSGAALEGYESMGAYAAKAALDASSRVLAKEVAPCNVRLLTVCIGTFMSNIGSVSLVPRRPLPEDYKGSVGDALLKTIQDGRYAEIVNSDKDKAAKAIYDVAMGEGAGAGCGDERFMMPGKDMIKRVGGARDQYAHALDVFEEISASVAIADKA
ncbi:hypothetical protein N7470_001968 [Penicillium chermesinum]|nr:hypothetical protein N7470_001968 [Penicillium chermesinum]